MLTEEGVDTLPALFSASREDIEGLKMKKGHIALVRGTVTVTVPDGKGPPCDGFDTIPYLRYTEMMGELAARYTWQSVLLLGEEYRQRQAKQDFAWGTPDPHLSTVMLRDHDRTPQAATAKKKRQTKEASNTDGP